MADKINDYNQYNEIHDRIKTIYTLTCDECGFTAERHLVDKDDAAESFESGGYIFRMGDGEKKTNKILCNACKDFDFSSIK